MSRSAPQQLDVIHDQFTLFSSSGTDLYATPKKGYIFPPDILYIPIRTKDFKSAGVTVNLHYETLYDQGGLVVVLPTNENPSPTTQNATTAATHPQWVKAGIEMNEGAPQISVVARQEWADWSLGSLPTHAIDQTLQVATYRIEIERAGNALKIFGMSPGAVSERRLVRQIQWVFTEERDNMWVGIYSARPKSVQGLEEDVLRVEFSNLTFDVHGDLNVERED